MQLQNVHIFLLYRGSSIQEDTKSQRLYYAKRLRKLKLIDYAVRRRLRTATSQRIDYANRLRKLQQTIDYAVRSRWLCLRIVLRVTAQVLIAIGLLYFSLYNMWLALQSAYFLRIRERFQEYRCLTTGISISVGQVSS